MACSVVLMNANSFVSYWSCFLLFVDDFALFHCIWWSSFQKCSAILDLRFLSLLCCTYVQWFWFEVIFLPCLHISFPIHREYWVSNLLILECHSLVCILWVCCCDLNAVGFNNDNRSPEDGRSNSQNFTCITYTSDNGQC